MKFAFKTLMLAGLILFNLQTVVAQNAQTGTSNTVPPIKNTDTPLAPSVQQGKEVTVVFKNTGERPIAIFAGPKDNIRDPKVVSYGGLSSNNKIYLRENDVVCIMNVQKLPIACTVVKPGVTTIEANSSGTGISAK